MTFAGVIIDIDDKERWNSNSLTLTHDDDDDDTNSNIYDVLHSSSCKIDAADDQACSYCDGDDDDTINNSLASTGNNNIVARTMTQGSGDGHDSSTYVMGNPQCPV